MNQALGAFYFAADEYERERVHQPAHDDRRGRQHPADQLQPEPRPQPGGAPNGDIMFARWEHVADRNRFAIFRTKPDGTDMFVLYGAQSPGNSFLHPRDMDPRGAYKGFLDLVADAAVGHAGGRLADDRSTPRNYSEDNTPANKRPCRPQGGRRPGRSPTTAA